MANLITNSLRINNAKLLKKDLEHDKCYAFIGKQTAWANEEKPDCPNLEDDFFAEINNFTLELSKNIYERGVDDSGFGRIRSKGDTALFGGNSTQNMKDKLGVPSGRPLADFLPTITITAKNLATEITNHNVKQKNLHGENNITNEHIQNNESIRGVLSERGIKPEELPAAEDLKKLERRVKSDEKKMIKQSALPKNKEDSKNE